MNPEPSIPSSPPGSLPAGWTALPDEPLPPPTFWPAAFGLGITFIFWGLITSWVVFAVGLIVFVGALAGWIVDLLHESATHHA